jgi:predicted GH43/DUF377 family glycosyl hydrolase
MLYHNHRCLYRGLVISIALLTAACNRSTQVAESATVLFPRHLVSFVPDNRNPLFSGTGADTWDRKIRERGYIIKESDGYHLWYTGYRGQDTDEKALGYATSPDGIVWTRHSLNPVFDSTWVEDMMVVKRDSLYYMFAEGKNDIAHLLTSADKVNWTDKGSLRIKQTNGEPLSPGPFGTPSVYVEGEVWHLYYERDDLGIWHATSKDLSEWKNVQDEPVIRMGPEEYDKFGVALNQIVKVGDRYYAYYHGTPTEDWSDWNTNVAVSDDLNTWQKFPGNPILRDNKSSGILVDDGGQLRLYTMHEQVQVHYPAK